MRLSLGVLLCGAVIAGSGAARADPGPRRPEARRPQARRPEARRPEARPEARRPEPPGLALRLRAPASCPSLVALRELVAEHLGEGALRAPALRADLIVWRAASDRWLARLDLRGAAGGRRELEGGTCREVIDAAALVIALAVENDGHVVGQRPLPMVLEGEPELGRAVPDLGAADQGRASRPGRGDSGPSRVDDESARIGSRSRAGARPSRAAPVPSRDATSPGERIAPAPSPGQSIGSGGGSGAETAPGGGRFGPAEPDGGRVAAEQDGGRVATDPDGGRVATDPDGGRVAAEQDGWRVAAEQDGRRGSAPEYDYDFDTDLGDRADPPRRKPVGASLRAGGAGESGTLPQAAAGVEAALAVWSARHRLELSAAYWPARAVRVGPGENGAMVGLWTSAVRGCRTLSIAALCGGGEIGRMTGRAMELPDRRDGAAWWGALSGSVWLRRPIGRAAIYAGLEGLVPVTRPRFELDDETVLYRPGPVAGRALFGLELSLF